MKNISFRKINKAHKGYTIIETMIAVSLFLVVIITGMGTFLNANALHQKSEDMRSIMDSLSFIMEDMSRNLRTGYTYRCISDVADLSDTVISTAKSGQSCWGIAFEPDIGSRTNPNDQWVYVIQQASGTIWKSTQGPNGFPNSYVQLTPEEVFIDATASGFSVLGAERPLSDRQQPFVVIKLVGNIDIQNIETPFSLQTSVSQRLIDV